MGLLEDGTSHREGFPTRRMEKFAANGDEAEDKNRLEALKEVGIVKE